MHFTSANYFDFNPKKRRVVLLLAMKWERVGILFYFILVALNRIESSRIFPIDPPAKKQFFNHHAFFLLITTFLLLFDVITVKKIKSSEGAPQFNYG